MIGAGVGAAVGNTAGALTGIYLLDLGVLPVLQTVKPEMADKIDPGNAVLEPRPGHPPGAVDHDPRRLGRGGPGRRHRDDPPPRVQ